MTRDIHYNTSSFNTQPPEGGCAHQKTTPQAMPGFNTQPPEGGCLRRIAKNNGYKAFQHTAARRRLLSDLADYAAHGYVSTHSRPKAAANPRRQLHFNVGFQHTAARRRLLKIKFYKLHNVVVSTHSRPKAAAIFK